jgi:hypothetical protein
MHRPETSAKSQVTDIFAPNLSHKMETVALVLRHKLSWVSPTAICMFRSFLLMICCWLNVGLVKAAPISEAEFHSKVLALYSFEPHKLKDAEMKLKSDQLDQFWSIVKADPTNTLPLLRRELASNSNSAFFYYNASKLLISLSKDRNDQLLALRSIPKVDLTGIQHTDYLRTIKWFADNEFDTREAAFRILAFPDFKAFIPQHALTLGQNYAFIYMLFPLDESVFSADLTKQLSLERNAQSLQSLLLALWYTATPGAKTAIKSFADNQTNPAEATSYAKMLLDRKVSRIGSFSTSSVQSLRSERRKVMQRPISDEALMEFDTLTFKLMAKQ